MKEDDSIHYKHLPKIERKPPRVRRPVLSRNNSNSKFDRTFVNDLPSSWS